MRLRTRTFLLPYVGSLALAQACAMHSDEGIEVEGLGVYLADEAESVLGDPSPAERKKMLDYLNTRAPASAIKDAIVIGNRVFDCVEIHKQWGGIAATAGDVPRAPSSVPSDQEAPELEPGPTGPSSRSALLTPSKPCPKDTVPMRHYELEDLTKYTTLDGWLNRRGFQPQALPGDDHEWAARRDKVSNIGMEATLNVWNPAIQTGQDEFSLMQTWVEGCTLNGAQT